MGLLLNGGCSLIEHPSCPEDSTLVSIWRLPIIYFLLGLPEVQLLEVMQGFHGAASAKPTALLALRLPELGVHLASNRIRKILPTAQSIGLSSDGSFKTSSLKEYPPALCRALGGCLANTISGFEVGGEEPRMTSGVSYICCIGLGYLISFPTGGHRLQSLHRAISGKLVKSVLNH